MHPRARRGARWVCRRLPAGREGSNPCANGLDIERLIGRVAESLAQFIDGSVDVGVVIDVRICGPQPHTQFLTRDDFAWFFEQREQNW